MQERRIRVRQGKCTGRGKRGGSLEVLSALILPGLIPAELVGLVVIIWRLLTYHLQLVTGGIVLWTQLRSR